LWDFGIFEGVPFAVYVNPRIYQQSRPFYLEPQFALFRFLVGVPILVSVYFSSRILLTKAILLFYRLANIPAVDLQGNAGHSGGDKESCINENGNEGGNGDMNHHTLCNHYYSSSTSTSTSTSTTTTTNDINDDNSYHNHTHNHIHNHSNLDLNNENGVVQSNKNNDHVDSNNHIDHFEAQHRHKIKKRFNCCGYTSLQVKPPRLFLQYAIMAFVILVVAPSIFEKLNI
jgi:hypothetical protein